jgi:hypothetical protein
MSGHVQGCPAVQPEPLAQGADLLAFDQVSDGTPEPLAQGIVSDFGCSFGQWRWPDGIAKGTTATDRMILSVAVEIAH